MFITNSDKISLKQKEQEFGPGRKFGAPTPSKGEKVALKQQEAPAWSGFSDGQRQTKADKIPLKKGGAAA